MGRVIVNETYLSDIADAIRDKLDTEDTYKPSEMAEAIESISGGSTPVINSLSVTENGTYTAPTGVDGYSPVTVNVPQGTTPTGTKQISITENGTITEDVANYANAEITVNVSGGSTYEDFSGGNIQAIISHGTEYILTNYLCPLGALFSIKFADGTITRNEGYFSTANDGTVTGIQRNANKDTLIIKYAGTSIGGVAYPGYSSGNPIVVTFSTVGKTTTESNIPLVIFGSYYNSALEDTKGAFAFYGLNIFDSSGNCLKRFRPWLDNGTPCVKELESGTIYSNSGTGVFDYIDLQGVTHNAN